MTTSIEGRILSAQSNNGRLSLCNQDLISVPESVWTLSSPSSKLGWWERPVLISIDLSQNHLEDVEVPDLPDLQHANLAHNRIKVITISALNLVSLNLSNNQLRSLPDLPSSLTLLNVSHNQLEAIAALPVHLKILQAGHNRLHGTPVFPKDLEVIDMSHNALNSMKLAELSNLTQANISCNQLMEFTGPPSLKSLDLSRNRLRQLPQLCSLILELNLSSNQISDISGIEVLDSLVRVDFSENQIKKIPEQIGNLSQLTMLNFRCNDLNDIPSELGRIETLKHIYLSGNPLRRIRPSVWQKGTETLKQYLLDRMAPGTTP